MSTLSVVINTLNEEAHIEAAINSIKPIAKEIVVCDMHSDDKTQSLAKKLGAKVITHKRSGYVEPARNYAIKKAKSDWILILDADERVTKTLREEIKRRIHSSEADYYAIPRKNIIFGKWIEHSRWWPDYNIRLFKKGHVTWNDEIHSVPITRGKGKDFPSEENYAIEHLHYETIEQYINRMNRYTSIQAKELHEAGDRASWHDLIKKPMAEFISRYFAGLGYKDGVHGLALASLQSLSELVTVLKLWQLSDFPEEKIAVSRFVQEIRSTQKEINYWTADTSILSGGGLVERVRRKLRI